MSGEEFKIQRQLPKAHVKRPNIKNRGITNTTIVSMKVSHASVVSKHLWRIEIASEERQKNTSSQLTSFKFFFNFFPLIKLLIDIESIY